METLHRADLDRGDKILIALFNDEGAAKTVAQIRQFLVVHGVKGVDGVKGWNIAHYLSQQYEKHRRAVLRNDKWELLPAGRQYLADKGLLPPTPQSVIAKARDDVRRHLDKIGDPQIRQFVDEAVGCLEANLLRAAVIMSWVGAVAVLHDHVIEHHLSAFNAKAPNHSNGWKPATNSGELAVMNEGIFLDVLTGIHILDPNVKGELKRRLDMRNSCGHPNAFQLGEQMVAAHIESLILHVYSPFC